MLSVVCSSRFETIARMYHGTCTLAAHTNHICSTVQGITLHTGASPKSFALALSITPHICFRRIRKRLLTVPSERFAFLRMRSSIVGLVCLNNAVNIHLENFTTVRKNLPTLAAADGTQLSQGITPTNTRSSQFKGKRSQGKGKSHIILLYSEIC
jgi:hypothetical protein